MSRVSPLVSVVIPSKNRADFLIEALESVFAQTYQNLEVIVVDDGSEPSVEPVLKSHYGNRIIFVRHEESRGAPVARNAGLKRASGEFIAFLDDDDTWLPDKIAKQMHMFEKCDHSVGLVYSGFTYVNDGVEFVRSLPMIHGDAFVALLTSNFIGSCSIPLVRKECYERVGHFDEKFKSFQDWDMWLRITKVFQVDFINETLVVRVVHGNQITSDIHSKIDGRELLLKKYSDLYIDKKNELSHQYRALSDNYFISGNESKGFEYSFMALKKDLISYRNVLNFILSILPRRFRNFIILNKKMQRIGDVIFYR